MRADRLLSILMLLQTRGRMTAHDLASQLEVSERTIYRDLDALGMAGVPVYTERGPNGGCSLVDGYQTRLTGLTEPEVRALFLFNMAAPLADLGLGKALDDALLKLEAALPASSREKVEQIRQRFHLDTTWWYHPADTAACLQIIQEALWQDRKLCLVYCENDGSWNEYRLDPYGLVSKAGIWYLIGLCDDCYHVWRVSRIVRTVLLEEAFQRLVDFDLARYWTEYCAQLEMNRPPYAVPLRLAPDDVARLPQLLSEWGYMLVESEEALEPDEQVIPLHNYSQRSQKKTHHSAANGSQWHDPQQKNGHVASRRSATNRSQTKKTYYGTSQTAAPAGSQVKKTASASVPQQKKEIRRPASRHKKNSIFVLNKNGDWQPLDGRSNAGPEEKKATSFERANTLLVQREEKKRIGPARIGSGGLSKEKKAPSPLIKKSNFPRPIKKTLIYFSLSGNLQSVLPFAA